MSLKRTHARGGRRHPRAVLEVAVHSCTGSEMRTGGVRLKLGSVSTATA